MLVLNLMVLILGYQLVFPTAMYESNYIGSYDSLEPNELELEFLGFATG